MTFTQTLAGLALAAACSLPVRAMTEPPSTWEWGTHPAFASDYVPFYGAVDFPFESVALFTLDGPADLLAQTEVIGYGPSPLTLSGAMVTLWRSNGDHDYRNDELLGGFDFGAEAMQQGFAGLGSGEYFYLIEGVASGSGNVVFTSSIPAVPEPGQWALMLAGLGVLGHLARRRQSA